MIDNVINLNKEDEYSAALMLLFVSKDNPRYSTLSELSYILDHDNFIKFIKYYEGQTISIPPIKETQKSLRMLMMYEYYVVEKLPWREALSKSGFEEEESVAVRQMLKTLKHSIDKYKVGDVINVEFNNYE